MHASEGAGLWGSGNEASLKLMTFFVSEILFFVTDTPVIVFNQINKYIYGIHAAF